jgi:hypothetical protein
MVLRLDDTKCFFRVLVVCLLALTATPAGKTINFWREGVGADLSFQFTNVLNHMVFSNPPLTLTSPTTFGVINGQANTPR